MKNHNIKAALFDLDGVIVFTDKYHYLAWKKLADEQGWDFDEKVNNRLRGVPRLASLEEILMHNKISLPMDKKLELMEIKNNYYVELLQNIDEGDIYPGAVEFIKKLREKGTKISLCSSSKNAELVISKLGLSNLFDAVVTGHDIKNAKPDPEIFLLGAKKLRIPEFHCVVFEDAKAGIEGALAAEMRAVGVGNKEETEELASFFIENYEEINIDTFLESGLKQPMPVDEDAIIEQGFNPNTVNHIETLFALGNGYMGLRGTYDEYDENSNSCDGMYINGIYAAKPLEHIVYFPNYSYNDEFTVNLTDWRIFNLYIDGEKACFSNKNIKDHLRKLDMRKGAVERSFIFETATGKRAAVNSIRIVNMEEQHSAQICYSVTPLNFSGTVVIESCARKITKLSGKEHASLVCEQNSDGIYSFVQQINTTKQQVATAITHKIDAANYTEKTELGDNIYTHTVTAILDQNETASICKFAAFSCSKDSTTDFEGDARRFVAENKEQGFKKLANIQKKFWDKHWSKGDVIIKGNPADQQAVRYSLFQLRQQQAIINDCSIGATGLTGPVYSGKAFWDTEMYYMPYYNFTNPESQKGLIMYRYRTLERARKRAEEYGLTGAMYPWCGISGEETSIVFEASVAEFHLQSDIAFSIWRYYDTTRDSEFIYNYGAEILFETAKFMSHRGNFIDAYDGKFCINVVCGPDEYSCGVDNNMYTNLITEFHFRFALKIVQEMKEKAPERFAELAEICKLSEEEFDRWQKAADNMYYRYNEKYGVHEQDTSFLYRDPIDMQMVPMNCDIRGIYHPLDLWRYQVIKQADVVLANFIFGDRFTLDEKLRNYEFYEPKCNHGSSLSAAIHAIMAIELKKSEGYEFFRLSAYMDLANFKKNTTGGIHLACSGGNWMTVVNGYLGMRHYVDGILFNPQLPSAWDEYNCKITYRDAVVDITVNKEDAKFVLVSGDSMSFKVGDTKVCLNNSENTFVCKTGK